MDEELSTSGDIPSYIPPELQNEVDVIATKIPGEAAKPSDLGDNQKIWLVVGICLHSIISPALRKYVDSVLTVFHGELVRNYKIDTQIYPNHQHRDPQTGVLLNYEAANNNKVKYGTNKAVYDYTIKTAVDLSKLFLQTHMAHYTGFDETCDSSALLGLISNIAKFDYVLKSHADDVRRIIRNKWAHCNFTEWDAMKYSTSFRLMKTLVKDLKLNLNEETLISEEMEKWEINGQRFLSGTTHGLELFNEFRQQTRVLAVYAKLVAKETDENFNRVKNELEKFEIIIRDKIEQIDKRLLAQDETLKKHDTQIEELGENVSKCACHDYHNVEIEFWKEQEVMFVETPIVKEISQILESKHSVLLVGEPGIGKSMLIHHIALKLHKKIEYSIIPCSGIQDIRDHYKEDTRQMFVLDDICGRFTVIDAEIDCLLKNEDSLKQILERGSTKIAATCRLDIHRDEKFHASCSLFTSRIFNLSERYSKENKLTICTKYLNESNIQLLKDQNESFTPLMCYLYSKNENFNLTDFLHCPYEIYRKEWEKIQSKDPYKYCALFLCVIFDGIIKESSFDIFDENINIDKKVLKNIFDICGVYRSTSISQMKKVLDGFIGTYLRKTRNEYRVIHDQMFDFMCCYFGNNDTLVKCILRHAAIQVFNERTQLESIHEQYSTFTILISRKHEEEYFERIKNDIQLGKLNQSFCNAQMKHDKYRALFLKLLDSININYLDNHNIIQDNVIKSCFRGYYDIVKYFISKDVDLDKGDPFNTPLTAACMGRNEKIVQLLIEKGCDVNHDGMCQTPLIVACMIGNEKIVMLLIDEGCDVNQDDGMGRRPLTVACVGGNEKIVQILIDQGCDVNQDDHIGLTPLTAACSREYDMILQLSVKRGCDVNQADRMGETFLTAFCDDKKEKIEQSLIDNGCDVNQVCGMRVAPLPDVCKGGKEKIVQILINKGCDVNGFDGRRETPLTAACSSGNEKIVQLLICKGSDINQVDGIGQTPLTVACSSGNEQIVQIRIDKGYNVNQVCGMRKTPLTAAGKEGNEKIVQLLIDKGSDVNQVDGMGQTPLIVACSNGNEKIVQLLIDKGSDVNQVYGMGQTALTVACSSGNEKIVQLLIDKGSDVNQVNGMGQTPLTVACSSGNEKIVELLIGKGSDVHQVDGTNMRETPLTAACKRGNEKIVQILIDKISDVNQVGGMGQTPLTAACSSGNEKIVELLIGKGSDVNQVDGTNMRETPLTAACKRGNEKIIQLLIDKGSDVNQVNGMGQTPLTAACSSGNEKIVELLIGKGSDVNQVDGTNVRETPLVAACKRGNEKIVQILIGKISDVNQVDSMGQTPLTVACISGNEKIVELLIGKGSDVNQVDGMTETPLTAACKRGNEKIVQILIDKRCNVNQVDRMIETPLTAACKRGNGKIVQLLIDKGCDVNQVNGLGERPLKAASKSGNRKIVQLLIDKGSDVNQVGGMREINQTLEQMVPIVQLLTGRNTFDTC